MVWVTLVKMGKSKQINGKYNNDWKRCLIMGYSVWATS